MCVRVSRPALAAPGRAGHAAQPMSRSIAQGDTARVAIVTGAALGIGEATAQRLIADGMRVAISDIDDARLAQAHERLSKDGSEILAHSADLSTAQGAQSLIDAVLAWHGRIDVLVNNAGGGVLRLFLDHDDASIAETISRNLLTTVYCCHAALPVMIKQRGGRIVNVGADSVRNGLLAHAMYNGAKGGVHGLTTGLAREFAGHGITVNCVAPCMVATDAARAWIENPDLLPESLRPALKQAIDVIPMGRAGEVEEVASAISYLASEEASFVTGQVLSVNGGSTML
jgi:2,3-dihydroxy-2,3-dihydro-p-cumate dehydrogenase